MSFEDYLSTLNYGKVKKTGEVVLKFFQKWWCWSGMWVMVGAGVAKGKQREGSMLGLKEEVGLFHLVKIFFCIFSILEKGIFGILS